jgi:hypothetical protein
MTAVLRLVTLPRGAHPFRSVAHGPCPYYLCSRYPAEPAWRPTPAFYLAVTPLSETTKWPSIFWPAELTVTFTRMDPAFGTVNFPVK